MQWGNQDRDLDAAVTEWTLSDAMSHLLQALARKQVECRLGLGLVGDGPLLVALPQASRRLEEIAKLRQSYSEQEKISFC